MLSKAFAPLVIIILVSSGLVFSGGGYAGTRYYQSVKLAQEGDKLYSEGYFEEAEIAYENSLKKWGKDAVIQKKSDAVYQKKSQNIFKEATQASKQNNWQICIDKLNEMDKDSLFYVESVKKKEECEKKITEENERIIAAQKAQEAEKSNQTIQVKTDQKTQSTTSSSESTTSNNDSSNTQQPATVETNTSTPEQTAQQPEEQSNSCVSNTSPIFTSHITDTSKITSIAIPPRIVGGHLKTHSYINTEHERVPVYAPIDMQLYGGVHLSHGSDPEDYGMDFKASCEVMLRIGHITDPIQSIKDTFPVATESSVTIYDITPINFKAGDLIGYTTGTAAAGNWDFGVYNSSTSNRFASDPDWNNSAIYTTAVCPYDYFSSSLKSTYSALYVQDFGTTVSDGEFFCQ